ncbi:unannotated protein [freshwater metagenome]|uniref:Unannotated protein n=1 Tax=freshwater metagenome TaxID=449393 RepID=A0A6J7NWM8_9ZZZZ
MTFTWTHLDEPDAPACEALIIAIEQDLGAPVHEIVHKHLRKRRTDPSHAFPRFEVHFDQYLFGHLHIPTEIEDGVPEFAELTIIATVDACWTVLRVPTNGKSIIPIETDIAHDLRGLIRRAQGLVGPDTTTGELLRRLFSIVVNELEQVITNTGRVIDKFSEELSGIDTRDLSRALSDQIPKIRQRAQDVRREVASLGTVIDELAVILEAIVNDDLDLHRTNSDGTLDEIFSNSTEIYLRDTYFRSRRLAVVHDEHLEKLQFVFESIKQLTDADEVISGRFIGAIASIMLLPTFIVGLYGMNFTHMPELDWPLGYSFAGFLIVAVTVFQVWYFRRKRWL